jgi:hypothetical protein
MQEDITKFYEKDNKAAIGIRKALQGVKETAQIMRNEVSAKNNA